MPNRRIDCRLRLLLVFLLALAGGCGGAAAPRCHPVRGRVLLNSEPVAEAQVVLYPRGGQAREASQPQAQTDAEGWFELTTVKPGDGAQAGDYVITVELREPRLIGEEFVREGPNLLPARYARPETTDLRYTVVSGRNEMPPLMLSQP